MPSGLILSNAYILSGTPIIVPSSSDVEKGVLARFLTSPVLPSRIKTSKFLAVITSSKPSPSMSYICIGISADIVPMSWLSVGSPCCHKILPSRSNAVRQLIVP